MVVTNSYRVEYKTMKYSRAARIFPLLRLLRLPDFIETRYEDRWSVSKLAKSFNLGSIRAELYLL